MSRNKNNPRYYQELKTRVKSEEHYCYKVHTLLTKSSAYSRPPISTNHRFHKKTSSLTLSMIFLKILTLLINKEGFHTMKTEVLQLNLNIFLPAGEDVLKSNEKTGLLKKEISYYDSEFSNQNSNMGHEDYSFTFSFVVFPFACFVSFFYFTMRQCITNFVSFIEFLRETILIIT